MSSLVVPITTVESVKPHPNADKLEIAQILGWQVVVGIGSVQAGDRVIYVPPDTVVPRYFAERWGVANHLHSVPDSYPADSGRVKAIKLRGEPSYGFVVPGTTESSPAYMVNGDNVADYFNLMKYEPPVHVGSGNDGSASIPEHPLFQRYTDIENLRHYPDILQPGEPVHITEKLHGCNTRIGIINGELCVGSRKRQWTKPDGDKFTVNWFWYPTTIPGVIALLEAYARDHEQVIIYGETYGAVQSMHYGHPNDLAWAAFDILIDGRYLSASRFVEDCAAYDIPAVPCTNTAYDASTLSHFASGETALGDDHIKEGIVIRPTVERSNPKIGRVILKYHSDAYLTSKHKEKEVLG